MRLLSLQRLLAIAAEKARSHIEICEHIAERSRIQITLLDEIALNSKRASNRNIIALKNLYKDTLDFSSIFEDKGNSAEFANEEKFIQTKFEFLDARHSTVVETLADFIATLEDCSSTTDSSTHLFLQGQHGVSLLLQHGFHLTSSKFYHSSGCVRTDTNIHEVCLGAINNAKMVAEHHYTRTPEVEVSESSLSLSSGTLPSICCIPSIVNFIVFELTKNAISSVIQKFENSTSDLPPVRITVSALQDSVEVLVRDGGIGFPSDVAGNVMFDFAGSRRRNNCRYISSFPIFILMKYCILKIV